jgi:isoaspartyl peptidase/L-asparaginase-like protein (Ntn-hydrolase superfamily)
MEDARCGAPPYRYDWDETHALNASFAAAQPLPARSEVVEFLEAGFVRMATALRDMTDDEIARPAWTYEGSERSVVGTVGVAARHAGGHLASIVATIG